MKIVGVDNHASELVSDRLWLDNVPDDDFTKRVVDRLNKGLGDWGGTFYKLVPDNYELYVYKL